MKSFFFIIFLNIFFFTTNVNSSNKSNLEIYGNARIEKKSIISIIEFDKTKIYSPSDINSMQKKLFETNFFKNVSIDYNNNIIKINVIENPLINFFYLKGVTNKKREDILYETLSLGQNKLFSESILQRDIIRIKQIYANSGYFNTIVTPEISALDNNNLNIVLNVERGEKKRIKRIFFIGDKYFKSSTLQNIISSSEHGWWKFFSSSVFINQERLNYDQKLLKNFYLNEGFYDVQILTSDVEEISKDKSSITFSINSGDRYNFLNYIIIDRQKNLLDDNLKDVEKILKNKLKGSYSLKKINDARDLIYQYLKIKKIEFVDFLINEKIDKNQIVNIEIEFYKTKPSYVNQINIKGNSITEEKVIRRELIFSEGDVISKYNLDKSMDNLKATGIFKDVKYSKLSLDGSADITNINISIQEQPTGSISAGVGVGSSSSSISSSITEKNLFGKGIDLGANLSIGTDKISGNIFTRIPDFLLSDNDFINNFYITRTELDNASYESTATGNNLSIVYDLFEDIELKLGAGLELDDIDTSSDASNLYQSRAGKYMTYKYFYNLNTDKTDSVFQPTKGHKFSIGQTIALPPSDIAFIENSFRNAIYHPVSKNFTFSMKTGLNTINAFNNDDVKLSDRKFLTNNQLRGFESYGVGPKDGKDHVGGNYSAFINLASTIPNPLPENLRANTLVFFDMGNVWGVDYDSSKDIDKLRSSAGIGLDWISPLGPLNFTFAQVLNSDDRDLEERFSFQIGSSF